MTGYFLGKWDAAAEAVSLACVRLKRHPLRQMDELEERRAIHAPSDAPLGRALDLGLTDGATGETLFVKRVRVD